MKQIKSLLLKIFGYCENCQRYFAYPKRRRMNTAYIDEESNYCIVCKECFEEIQEHWKERWEEYYAERL